MAATVPVEKAGDVNPLLEQAQQVGVDEASDQDVTARGRDTVNDPPVGSYERFMSSFGNPARWAGRS